MVSLKEKAKRELQAIDPDRMTDDISRPVSPPSSHGSPPADHGQFGTAFAEWHETWSERVMTTSWEEPFARSHLDRLNFIRSVTMSPTAFTAAKPLPSRRRN